MNVENIRVIKVGEEEIKVENTSAQVQQMVEVYNEWRQNAADRKSELSMAEMALRSLGVDIQNTILHEREKAAQELAATNEAAADSEETIRGVNPDEATAADCEDVGSDCEAVDPGKGTP